MCFQIWLSWGLVPVDFWNTSPRHFWWIYDTKNDIEESKKFQSVGLTVSEAERLYERWSEGR